MPEFTFCSTQGCLSVRTRCGNKAAYSPPAVLGACFAASWYIGRELLSPKCTCAAAQRNRHTVEVVWPAQGRRGQENSEGCLHAQGEHCRRAYLVQTVYPRRAVFPLLPYSRYLLQRAESIFPIALFCTGIRAGCCPLYMISQYAAL